MALELLSGTVGKPLLFLSREMWHACVVTLRDLSSACTGHREQRLLTSYLTRCKSLETSFDISHMHVDRYLHIPCLLASVLAV